MNLLLLLLLLFLATSSKKDSRLIGLNRSVFVLIALASLDELH